MTNVEMLDNLKKKLTDKEFKFVFSCYESYLRYDPEGENYDFEETMEIVHEIIKLKKRYKIDD